MRRVLLTLRGLAVLTAAAVAFGVWLWRTRP